MSAELCQSVMYDTLVGLVGRTIVASMPDKVIFLHNAYNVSSSAQSCSYLHTLPMNKLCSRAAVMHGHSQVTCLRAGMMERRVSQ